MINPSEPLKLLQLSAIKKMTPLENTQPQNEEIKKRKQFLLSAELSSHNEICRPKTTTKAQKATISPDNPFFVCELDYFKATLQTKHQKKNKKKHTSR